MVGTPLQFVATAVCLWSLGAGLGAQAPEDLQPKAPATSLRTNPTEAEKSTWRTKLPWEESSEKATTPTMRGRLYHQEYLSRVTPEAFRRSAMGTAPQLSADPGKVLHRLASGWRGRQQRRMEQQVERELAALLHPR